MNRLLTLLTAACGALAASGAVSAMPLAPNLAFPEQGDALLRVQLGNGGPVGGGPNGGNNGTGSSGGNGGVRGGVSGGPLGTGPGGRATTNGLLPNDASRQPNGSKPAPMRPNGVRDVQ